MKYKFIFGLFVRICFCLMLFSCVQTEKSTFPNPEIKAGIAKVSGKIIGFQQKEDVDNPVIRLSVVNNVTADVGQFETKLNDEGKFYFEEVPIEYNTIGFISSPLFNGYNVGIGLVADEESQIEISYGKNKAAKANFIKSSLLSTSDNLYYSYEFIGRFVTPSEKGQYEKCYDLNPEEYIIHSKKIIENRLKYGLNRSHLSKRAEDYTYNNFKLFYIGGILLSFSSYNSLNYKNFKSKEDPDDFTPQEPGKSYYSFLKEFDLNNPQHLYSNYYSKVLEAILRNDTLNIPSISEITVDEWMREVKSILSELVGFDEGLFYDVLAANSYARQLNSELKPLSEKQIENIKSYYSGRNKEFVNILLRKNEEIIKLEEGKSTLVVNETPAAPKEKLMEAIVSKYKGKVVIIDLWATWCGPCLEAMKQYREVKGELKDKNVVFVYLTNSSSPKKLWEEKIKGIGGEHYYLNKEEWENISYSEKYGFEGIPTYIIFDTKGELIHKFSGYPGNAEILRKIKELL